MSETYVVAARLRLKKKAATAWLRSPWPDPGSLDWPSKPAFAFDAKPPSSVRQGLARVADEVASNEIGGLVAAWDGAARSFLLYHVMIGFQPEAAARSLLAIAAAAGYWTLKRSTHALFFAETGARLWAGGVLAVLEVDGDGARFVSIDPASAVADLAPAEARWDEALDMGVIDAMHDPNIIQPQIRQASAHPLLKKRKREVPAFESAEEWLTAISSVKILPRGEKERSNFDYASWGRFEGDIVRYAEQVVRFGADVIPRLEALLQQPAWEPGVIAFWALNRMTLETQNPSFYLKAITLWRTWSEANQGWGRGEVTERELKGALADHKAALAGTRFARRGLLALARSKEELTL